MNIDLKDFQKKAVAKLLKATMDLFETDTSNKTIVFHSPTGSGKTVTTAEYIRQFCANYSEMNVAFIWVSVGKGNLHIQSRDKLSSYYDGFPAVHLLENYRELTLASHSVVVVNFEKLFQKDKETGEWSNRLMRSGDYSSFIDVLQNTRRAGTKIILIVDESHLAGNDDGKRTNIKELRNEVICPELTVEVSATPSEESKMGGENKRYVPVTAGEVIKEELIKRKILINSLVDTGDGISASDEFVLNQANERRIYLALQYESVKVNINPLVLVQIPDSTDGEAKKNLIIGFLAAKGITVENGKLAIWLSSGKKNSSEEEKVNLDGISQNNNPAQFLIFKQAVATGWDCPRAQILVKFREPSASENFDIQTVGRILRMPEGKYYSDDILNYGYVYTNIQNVIIKEESKKQIAKSIEAVLRPEHSQHLFSLPGEYINAEKRPELSLIPLQSIFGQLVSERLQDYQLQQGKLMATLVVNQSIETRAIVEHEETKIEGEEIGDWTIAQIEEQFAKKLRFAVKSFANQNEAAGIIKDVIVSTLMDAIGVADVIEIKKLVIQNGDFFVSLLDEAISAYREREKKKQAQKTVKLYEFELGSFYTYDKDIYESCNLAGYLLAPCLLYVERSEPEKVFEGVLDKLALKGVVQWWWKNGSNDSDDEYGGRKYFSISYELDGVMQLFFPDYLVRFSNGLIGIFEVKDYKDDSAKTKAKAARLQEYLQENNYRDIIGGIVTWKPAGETSIVVINMQSNYQSLAASRDGWVNFMTVVKKAQ